MTTPPERKLLEEQLAYYRAHPWEYDESILQSGRFAGSGIPPVDAEWQHIVKALHNLPPVRSTLELACGTRLVGEYFFFLNALRA